MCVSELKICASNSVTALRATPVIQVLNKLSNKGILMLRWGVGVDDDIHLHKFCIGNPQTVLDT